MVIKQAKKILHKIRKYTTQPIHKLLDSNILVYHDFNEQYKAIERKVRKAFDYMHIRECANDLLYAENNAGLDKKENSPEPIMSLEKKVAFQAACVHCLNDLRYEVARFEVKKGQTIFGGIVGTDRLWDKVDSGEIPVHLLKSKQGLKSAIYQEFNTQ